MNICVNCQKETKNPKFCSRSCSASVSNRLSPKRKMKRKCVVCGEAVSNYRKKRCDYHTEEYKNKKFAYVNKTLSEYHELLSVKDKHPSWANAHFRAFARSWNKDMLQLSCAKCGYSKHVELCHIKAVSSFPLTATIGEVNARGNRIQLCPNCHWEFDNLPRAADALSS